MGSLDGGGCPGATRASLTLLVSQQPVHLTRPHCPLSSSPVASFLPWAFAQVGPYTWSVFAPLPDQVLFLFRSSLKWYLLGGLLGSLTAPLNSVSGSLYHSSNIQQEFFV